jgi:hypothetical protein
VRKSSVCFGEGRFGTGLKNVEQEPVALNKTVLRKGRKGRSERRRGKRNGGGGGREDKHALERAIK